MHEYIRVVKSIPQEDTMTMIEQFYGNLLLEDDLAISDDNQQSIMVGVAAPCCYCKILPTGQPLLIHARSLHYS